MIQCPRCSEMVPMRAILPESGLLGLLRRVQGVGRFRCPCCETVFKGPPAVKGIVDLLPSMRRDLELDREQLRIRIADQISTFSASRAGSSAAMNSRVSSGQNGGPESGAREVRLESRTLPLSTEVYGQDGVDSTPISSGPVPVSKRSFSSSFPGRSLDDRTAAESERNEAPSDRYAGRSTKMDDSIDRYLRSSAWKNLREGLEPPENGDRTPETDLEGAPSENLGAQERSESLGRVEDFEKRRSNGVRSGLKKVQTIHRRQESVPEYEEPGEPVLRAFNRLG
jgi:hypothetical protein